MNILEDYISRIPWRIPSWPGAICPAQAGAVAAGWRRNPGWQVWEIQVGKFEKSRLGTLRNTRCKCKSSHTKLNLMQPKQIPASGKYVNIVLLKNNQFYFQGWVSKLFPFLRPVNMRGGMCTVQSLSLCQRESTGFNPDSRNIRNVQETSHTAYTVMKDKHEKLGQILLRRPALNNICLI